MSTPASSAKLAATPAVNEAIQARIAPKVAVAQAIDPKSNPVAQIISAEMKPEQKSQEIATFLSPETHEAAKESIKSLESYKEYLAQHRTLMQRKLIELSSTTVFAKMNKTFGDMNQGVLDFREMMRPLVENLEALYTLRTAGQGVVLDTFAEIADDRKKEKDWSRRNGDLKSEVQQISSDKDKLEREIAVLKTHTGMFGGIKKSALAQIAEKEHIIQTRLADLQKVRDKAAVIVAEQTEHDAKQGKYKAEKDQVRKMLDISGPEHVKRVEAIIKAALDYIDKSQVTVAELRGELSDIDDQADKLVRVNGQMTTVVAILDKGIDIATASNKAKVQTLSVVPADEDTLGRVERERRKNDLERHVTALVDSGVGTKKTVSDLEKDAVNANMFHDAVGKQIVNIRELSSDGIASIATSLNTSIQALNNSALNEASEGVRDSMREMNKVNDSVLNKEVIRSALQLDDTSKRIIEKIDSLSNIGESLQAANKLREDGLNSIAKSLSQLNDVTTTVRSHLQESIGMDAKSAGVAAVTEKAKPAAMEKESPFGNL
jgi:hypothetical protein